jgi:alpha-1,3-fucosyltransferase
MSTNLFENCREKRCHAFRYASKFQTPLEESDGIIVHSPNLLQMPSKSTYKRNPKQLWSFFTLESQILSHFFLNFKITDLDDWFNLTKTIKSPYAYFPYDLKHLHNYERYINAFKKSNNSSSSIKFEELLKNTTSSKSGLAFWFVSDCKTTSKRELLVLELAKYIKIDIFGRCNFKNSRPDPCQSSRDQSNCLAKLYNSYKFYLSFENGNCDSYITEKYFKFYEANLLFEVNIVPIVRGALRSQYLDRAPSNHSFIYADEFKNVKSLADYILYLDLNNTAYFEYFEWKRILYERLRNQQSHQISTSTHLLLKEVIFAPLCDLCEKLYDSDYMNNTEGRNGVLKISDYYNPAKDCQNYDGLSGEEVLEYTKYNYFWATYHVPFWEYYFILLRIFIFRF